MKISPDFCRTYHLFFNKMASQTVASLKVKTLGSGLSFRPRFSWWTPRNGNSCPWKRVWHMEPPRSWPCLSLHVPAGICLRICPGFSLRAAPSQADVPFTRQTAVRRLFAPHSYLLVIGVLMTICNVPRVLQMVLHFT